MNEIVNWCFVRRERKWRLEVSGKENGGERAESKWGIELYKVKIDTLQRSNLRGRNLTRERGACQDFDGRPNVLDISCQPEKKTWVSVCISANSPTPFAWTLYE